MAHFIKSRKSSAHPNYVDPCAPPEPEPAEPVAALLSESAKQTALLTEIVAELKAMRILLSDCV
jgi:hypothetical protein